MEVKKIVEGMTAPQVAQVIDDNFKGLNEEKANKVETDEKLSELGSKTNIHFVKEVDSTYTPIDIPFFFQKGVYIKNSGIPLILAEDASLSGRIDIGVNELVLINSDKHYIQTSNVVGTVDFELINNLPYGEWKEREIFLPKRYVIEGFEVYSTLNLFTTFPKGSTIVNHGVNLIFAKNNSLEERLDIGTGSSVVLDSDKKHVRTTSVAGTVDFEVFYAPENSISGNSILDGTISEKKVSFIEPINLVGTINVGQYYSVANGYNYNTAYDATSKISIVEGKSYCFNSYTRFIHMCDSGGKAIRTIESNPPYVTAEHGEVLMVVTFYATEDKQYQVEKGTSPSIYVAPTNNYINKELIPPTEDKQISFKRWSKSGSIAFGKQLTLDNINITKNIVMTAIVKGNIESVSMGVGLNGYYGKNITITPTDIVVKSGSNNTINSTFHHGLNITDYAVVQISKNDDSETAVRVSNDKGEKYEVLITWGHNVGQPFVLNGSTDTLDVVVNFMPRDIAKDIWMFGDSYFGVYDPSRWPYYILKWGYNKFLLDAKGGEDATEGLNDFKSLLSLGAKPKYVVWCHGMNGGADASTSPNSTWLSKTEELINLCLNNDIIPVLATIPSVPARVHIYMNEWVRNSGHRYIDFASAVETNGSLYWKGWGTSDALLSSDEVHPSEKGAVVLASQVMVDFPEIAVSLPL